jgi:hypothetical protein
VVAYCPFHPKKDRGRSEWLKRYFLSSATIETPFNNHFGMLVPFSNSFIEPFVFDLFPKKRKQVSLNLVSDGSPQIIHSFFFFFFQKEEEGMLNLVPLFLGFCSCTCACLLFGLFHVRSRVCLYIYVGRGAFIDKKTKQKQHNIPPQPQPYLQLTSVMYDALRSL